MRGNSNQEIHFSKPIELRKQESIISAYVFEDLYFRFTTQSISITKIIDVSSFHQIYLENQHIVEDVKRMVGETGQKCMIKKVFPQYQSIYLLIEVSQNFYLGEITLQRITHQLKNIFHSVVRFENSSFFKRIIELSISTYIFFPLDSEKNHDLIFLLAEDEENKCLLLVRGKMIDKQLAFHEEIIQQKQIKCYKANFYMNQMAIILHNGERRIYELSKKKLEYVYKRDLTIIVEKSMRQNRQIKNGNQYGLIATAQTPVSFYFLFVVNPLNGRCILIRWTKDNDFQNVRQYRKYSFQNPFNTRNQARLHCLKQSDNRILLILEQECSYYLLEVVGSQKIKVRPIISNEVSTLFGIHDKLLLGFNGDVYSQVQYSIDQDHPFLKFQGESKIESSKQSIKHSGSQTKSNTDIALSNHDNRSVYDRMQQLSIEPPAEIKGKKEISVMDMLSKQFRNQPQSIERAFSQQGPNIDYKGNTRIHNTVISTVKQVDSEAEEQQQQEQRIKSTVQAHQASFSSPPLPSFPPQQPPRSFPLCGNNIFGASNTNPLNIIMNPKINETNDNLFSLNPSQTANMNPSPPPITANINPSPPPPIAPVNGQYISFGVPSHNQPPPQVSQPPLQVPSISRGYSFGNESKQKKNVPPSPQISKPVSLKPQARPNLRLLRGLPSIIKQHKSNQNKHQQWFQNFDKEINQISILSVLTSDFRQKQNHLKKNKQFWFVSQDEPFQKIYKEVQLLKEQFQSKFQMISNNINRKILQFGLNHKSKAHKSQSVESFQEEKIRKTIIKFKLKLQKQTEEISKLTKGSYD